MEVSALAGLLEAGRYAECIQAAEVLLRHGALPDGEKARAFLAQSYAQAALQASQEAVGPAELAVHFSRTGSVYDVAAHALCHLADLCYENQLYKRALQCLDEYFSYITLYGAQARSLEGWVLSHTGLAYQAMGRGPRALEYFQKAYRWYVEHSACPQQVDQARGDLAWQLLRQGQPTEVTPLLEGSAAYLREHPNDLDARARLLNNRAYRNFLLGHYSAAIDTGVHSVQMRGASALRKAQACLILHHAARAMGLWKEARGLGFLARIQAGLSKRPDLEQEAVRCLLHLHQGADVPLMDELVRSVARLGHSPAAATRE